MLCVMCYCHCSQECMYMYFQIDGTLLINPNFTQLIVASCGSQDILSKPLLIFKLPHCILAKTARNGIACSFHSWILNSSYARFLGYRSLKLLP
mmetsp:Transcript_8244/g.15302  ORF Transcript_8244/g.15302 Transcript_8244/m.15302 type:complete len:94 (+) Transcript_8244:130-411(+)